MTLVLQGVKLNDEALSQPLIGRFDERGGTVGRSDNATFTLPDPERLISRVHIRILFGDEGYWLEQVSTANSTSHNGRPLSAGMRVLLSEGDELRVGGYTLIAAFESDETSATVLRGRTVIMTAAGPPTRPRAPVNGTDPITSFLQGAGIDSAVQTGLAPESARELGILLTGSMRSALEVVLDRYASTDVERESAQKEFQRLLVRAFRQAYEASDLCRKSPAINDF